MKIKTFSFLIAFVMTMLFASFQVAAGPGHDHGDAAPAANTGKASPRFEAHSESFEVVGVLGGSELSILIDRYKNNEPILNAKVELESGAMKVVAAFHADHGDYSVSPKAFDKPGTYPISLTITAGNETDILAGNLIVPAPEAGHANANAPLAWKRWVAIGAAIAASLLLAMFILRRRAGRNRRV
jgi:hypothetical protein